MRNFLSVFPLVHLAFLLSQEPAQASDQTLYRVYFVNVGQGDLSFIASNKHCLFFDAGGDQSKLPDRLKTLLQNSCSTKVNWLFVSHYDRDHISKSFSLFQVLRFEKVFLSHTSPQSQLGKKTLEQFKRLSTVVIWKKGARAQADGIRLECFAPAATGPKQPENNKSLVIRVELGHSSLLYTGDSPVKPQMLAESKVDILKVAHHGSQHNSSPALLRKLKPQACIVSVGAVNKYGHPHKKSLDTMAQSDCAILRTDRLGTIQWNF